MDNDLSKQLSSGRAMPLMGLGTWRLDIDTEKYIAAALDMGYRMIDTSGDYGTQPGVAEGIKMSGLSREDLYIVTKVEEDDDGYEKTVENLEELGLGYTDLVLIHRPPEDSVGEAIWDGLIRARDEGLAKDIGVSNYTEDQIQELFDATGDMPVVNQIEWSPFGWSQSMLEFCEDNHIIIQAYSPLTRGERLNDGLLNSIANRYDRTPAQVMIRWCIDMGVVPIVKSNQISHLQDNLDVFDWSLSEADVSYLSDLNESYSALGDKLMYI